jgi:hypothetical protein
VDPDAIFATFQKYQHEAAKFSAPEIALIKIFGLEELNDPHRWANLVKVEKNREATFKVIRGLHFSHDYFPKIIKQRRQGNRGSAP